MFGFGFALPQVATRSKGVRGPAAALGEYNFNVSQFATAKAALARVAGGTGRMTIGVVGDSTKWGVGGGDNPPAYDNAKNNNAISQMALQLAALGYPTSRDSFFGSGGNSGVISMVPWQNVYKPGTTIPSPWDQSGDTVGGQQFRNATDATPMTFVSEAPCDRIELTYPMSASVGVFEYNLDGGSYVQVTETAGANALGKTVITAPSVGIHTVNIRRVSGDIRIIGIRAWDSTTPAIDVLNFGRSSSGTTEWNSTFAPWSTRPFIQSDISTYDLVILDLMINDCFNNMNIATYNSQLQTLITDLKADSASVMLMVANPCNTSTIVDTRQQTFRNAVRALAVSNDLPCIDQHTIYTSWAAMDAIGYADSANGGLHPTKLLYADLGQRLASAVTRWSV